MASSQETYLKVYNFTGSNITNTVVSSIDNNDWDGDSRPDHNFNGVQIDSLNYLQEREEINSHANSAWFTIEFTFANGDTATLRNDQFDALNDGLYRAPYSSDGNYIFIQEVTGGINEFMIVHVC